MPLLHPNTKRHIPCHAGQRVARLLALHLEVSLPTCVAPLLLRALPRDCAPCRLLTAGARSSCRVEVLMRLCRLCAACFVVRFSRVARVDVRFSRVHVRSWPSPCRCLVPSPAPRCWAVFCGGSGNHVLIDADSVQETTVQLGPVLKVPNRLPLTPVERAAPVTPVDRAAVAAAAGDQGQRGWRLCDSRISATRRQALQDARAARVPLLTASMPRLSRVFAGACHTRVRRVAVGGNVQRRSGAHRQSLRSLSFRSALVEPRPARSPTCP